MVFTCVVAGALVLLFTRLPLGARTRRLLTPLAAQHRLTRLDEDSNDWEQAFAGELLWLATRGVLRIQEVDDAGAARRLTDAGYSAPRFSGWEVEWRGNDQLLPAWSQALINALFPGGRKNRGARIRVDRTGLDDPARRAAMKSDIVRELDRARVDQTDKLGWVSELLASIYSKSFGGVVIGYLALLFPVGFLPIAAKIAYVAAWLTLAVLTFIRPPLQRRWTKLWERYRIESRELHEVPLAERGDGATRVVYLDAFAENLGFADIVATGQLEDMAGGYAEQAEAMVREGLLETITPDWLVAKREQLTPKQLVELVGDFHFTVR